MRTTSYLLASALCLAAGTVQAMPVTGGAVRDAADASNPVQQTAVYVYEGHPYCFYFDGWHGPGWYRCGFAWRRGFGWGGVYGWLGWNYGPAERRLGAHFGHGERYGAGTYRNRGVSGFNERGAVQQGGNLTTRGSRLQGETTGSGVASPNVRSGAGVNGGGKFDGGAKIEGGNVGGGASVGGGVGAGGGEGRRH